MRSRRRSWRSRTGLGRAVVPEPVREPGVDLHAAGSGSRAVPDPRHAQLEQMQFPLQGLVLALALRHLQTHHREVVLHQLTDLQHRRVRQHLHDGGQLGPERQARRHR